MGTIDEDTTLAVVGAAFELPQCNDWQTLTALLREGRDAIRQLPQKRAESTGVFRSDTDREGGWIDDVTGFDHRYFGLSKAEAELIDPRQRRMLHLAVQAIGEAGYAPAELAGSNTAVVVAGYGGPHPSLFNLLPAREQRGGPAMTGSLHAYAAGRVAYHLDLRGPAQVIDTSCSSFLVALHEARWKLARGESDLALVGGYELVLGSVPRRAADTNGLDVLSAADRCRPFDAAADGTTYGEGGGFILVKRLADAIHDGDTVSAVIRGSAVNQDAGRSTGLTAPSPAAQTEVITAAWRDAKIEPATIGYIEAHGTGTKIGDPIEIHGLVGAFAGAFAGDRAVSSVKGNVGHLGCMASFAGLMRIIAQFRAGEVFPTAHFRRPSPLLALDGGPLRIADRSEPWPDIEGPRRAALSSFGLSGTNAHMVIEQGPATSPPPFRPADRPVVLSARDIAGLHQQVRRVCDLVAADMAGFDLAAAAEVLIAGREHFPYRHGWVVRDSAELLDRLNAVVHGPAQAPALADRTPPPLVLVLGDALDVALSRLREYAAAYSGFARVFADAEALIPAGTWTPAQRVLVWQMGGHAVLGSAGIPPELILAHGLGATAARVLRGESDLATALNASPHGSATPAPPNTQALRTALAGLGAEPVIVDLSPGSALSGLLEGEPRTAVATSAAEALCAAYLHGRDVDWRAVLGRAPSRRLELPVAALREEHCWPALGTPPDEPGTAAPAARPEPAEPAGSVEDVVLAFARDVLKEPGLEPADDFFDAGGNSLNGVQLVSRVNERFGTDLEVLDLFDLPDLRSLAEMVAEATPGIAAEAASGHAPGITPESRPASGTADGTRPAAITPPAQAPAPEPLREGPLSGQQTAIWAADRLDPESGAYNVPAALLLDGDADTAQLSQRLTALTRRHPMLRAGLRDTPDGPRQVIHPADGVRVELEKQEFDLADLTAAEGHGELLTRLRALVTRPLSPYAQPPARYQLIRARFADGDRHVLLLTFHHLFVDGWSWRLLFEDLAAGSGASPASERDYFDYVHEQREMFDQEAGHALEAFWSGYLDGARYVPLPADRTTSETAEDAAGAELALPIGPELADSIRKLAQRQRCTSNMVLLAAWAALLWKICGERDVTIAVPAAGRAPADEPVVGNYANTLVVRIDVPPDEPFSTLLAAVRDASLTTLAHQELPTDRIRRIARPASPDPLASTMFSFNSDVEPLRRLGDDGPAVELLDVGQGAPTFPLNVAVLEYGQDMRAGVQYATGLFHAETVRGWLDDYRALLLCLTERGPDEPTAALTGPAGEETAASVERLGRLDTPPAETPDTEIKVILAQLWAQRLKRDEVGLADDFFDLGGDSVTAIAIASDAERRGLALRPRTILELRTLQAVAARTEWREEGASSSGAEADGAPSGEARERAAVELTPPQLEFLARGPARPNHWNHGVLYSARRPLHHHTVERALGLLAERHSVLRARFHESGGLWTQTAAPEAPPVIEFDLRGTPADQVPAEMDKLATGLHTALDLRTGPVCRAGLFRLPGNRPDQLVLIVHHAMVDLYSWNVLTEELSVLLRDGHPGELGAAGPSYFHWAHWLASRIRSTPAILDASYWLDRLWGDGAQLPTAPEGPRGVEGHTQELITEMAAPAAAGPSITLYERLLAALGAAFQQWLGARGGEVAVQLVSHGREDLFPDLDLGRTVGYFNTTYPFALALPGRRTAADHAAYVAREMQSVPRRGFDFEALRRFHPEARLRGALDAIPVPGVLFSFWGTPAFLEAGRGGDADGVLTDVRTEGVGRDRPFDMARPCPLEIYPSVSGGRLTVQWRFSGEVFTTTRIQDLANAFGAALTDQSVA